MISKILIQKIIREEINKLIESPGEARPPQSTTKILPKSDEDAHVDRKIYGGSTLDLDVDGKPNNPKKFGASDIYKSAREENKNKTLSEGLHYHLKNSIPIDDNVYRPGTRKFFALIKEAKSLWEEGKYSATPEEYEIFQSDIGEWAMYEGKRVPLDFPMWDSVDEEKKGLWHNIRQRREKGLPKKKPGEKGYPDTLNIDEAKYKGREVKLGTAGASQSGGRAHVYIRDPKSGNIRKVSFGSGMPDAMGSSPKHKKRRKSFAARHGCSKNHDKTSASYWACRSTKMFGRNVPGWW
jgi:hypothetical protein